MVSSLLEFILKKKKKAINDIFRNIKKKENTGNKNPSVKRTKQNKLMLVLSCAVCGKKKSRFNENKEVH